MKTYSRKIVFGLIAFALWAIPTKSNAQEEKNPLVLALKHFKFKTILALEST